MEFYCHQCLNGSKTKNKANVIITIISMLVAQKIINQLRRLLQKQKNYKNKSVKKSIKHKSGGLEVFIKIIVKIIIVYNKESAKNHVKAAELINLMKRDYINISSKHNDKKSKYPYI